MAIGWRGGRCVVGALFVLNVDDDHAYDIDEPVTLTLTYATGLTRPFIVGWDRNGDEGVGITDEIAPEPGGAFASTTLTVDGVRLASRGVQDTDVAVGARNGSALCHVSVERCGESQLPTRFGRLVHGAPTATWTGRRRPTHKRPPASMSMMHSPRGGGFFDDRRWGNVE